jgi:hypothetical protein
MKQRLIWLRKYNVLFITARVVFVVSSLIALLLWIFKEEIKIGGEKYQLEPIFTALTTIGLGFTVFYQWLLSEASYSPAYTLAYGYVENFLEPVITQMLENGVKGPLIYIYRADDIGDLTKANIDRIKAFMAEKNYTLKEVQLSLKYARARDVLSVQGTQKSDAYFDFPNTITTLYNYIEYRLSKNGDIPKPSMQKISVDLLNQFYMQVEELMKAKKLDKFIYLCREISEIK